MLQGSCVPEVSAGFRIPAGSEGSLRFLKLPQGSFQGSQIYQGSQTFRDFGNSQDTQHFIRFAICPRLPIPMLPRFPRFVGLTISQWLQVMLWHLIVARLVFMDTDSLIYSNIGLWISSVHAVCFADLHFVGFHVCFISMSVKSFTTLDLTSISEGSSRRRFFIHSIWPFKCRNFFIETIFFCHFHWPCWIRNDFHNEHQEQLLCYSHLIRFSRFISEYAAYLLLQIVPLSSQGEIKKRREGTWNTLYSHSI